MSTSKQKLSAVPREIRERLSAMSIPRLLEIIEQYGFESVGGSLESSIHWQELRARIERLSKLVPPSGVEP